MSNSSLISYTKLSPSITSPRKYDISRITIHCFVGMADVKNMCEYFYNKNNKVSCNYVIDMYGSIGLVVDEENRSWCSSNSDNDNRAITIEVASEKEHPYSINNQSFKSLLSLCKDICTRNGKNTLLWIDSKSEALSYNPKGSEMLITVHRWFANKACPGEYIYNLLPYIANEVTNSIANEVPERDSISSDMQWAIDQNLFKGYGDGKYGPQDALTREQAASLLKRFYDKFIK